MGKILPNQTERSYAYVWDGLLLYAPSSLSNTLHAHFAATVLIGLEGPIAITLEDGERKYCDIAVLAPNVKRSTDSEEHPLVDFLIDPDDPLYCFLHPLLAGQPMISLSSGLVAELLPRLAGVFNQELDCNAARQLVTDTLRCLCPEPIDQLPWDSRVQQANRYMRNCLPDHLPDIPEIAREVGLSESRFMHLFRDEMGLPVRQYLLWLRIRQAMKFWAMGHSLSDIAQSAGFYDQAHFTKTIRRMTDYAPSMLSDPQEVVRKHCGC